MTSNPSELFNGMTSAQPFEPWQIDQHADAASIWATIARHRAEAFEDGADDAHEQHAKEWEEQSKQETIDRTLSVVQEIMLVLNIAIVNGDWNTEDLDVSDDCDEFLKFLESVRV